MSRNEAGENAFAAMTEAWTTMASSFFQGATAANRAAASALFPPGANGAGGPGLADENGDDTVAPSVDSLSYERLDWTFERTADDPADLGIGDSVTFEKNLADEDVRAFARASGDTNRLHLDNEFARTTRFGGRIAHGTLASGLISAALARLPGLTIYLSQDLEFRGPVGVGDRVSARVEIVEDLGDGKFRLETTVEDESAGETAVAGEAVVLIDDFPEADD